MVNRVVWSNLADEAGIELKMLKGGYKFIYSEKATKFCKIFTVDLPVKLRANLRWCFRKIFVSFSQNLNFN